MPKLINIHAAKTHLSRLVERAAKGEEIILAKAGKPLAKLVPYQPNKKARTPGMFEGKGWEAEGCWESEEELFKQSVEGPLFHGAVEEPRS